MITFDSEKNLLFSTKINSQYFFSGFCTKQNGNAQLIADILHYFSLINLAYDHLVTLEQIHSTNIAVITKNSNKIITIDESDGAITNEKKTILTVRTADCAPIIYCDKKNKVIGISHNGWRSTLKKISQKLINKMIEKGAELTSIIAVIGPCIGSCCYDIDDDRYYYFIEEFDGYADKIFQVKKGKRYLNLTLLNYLLLIDAGIKKENIDYFPFCTKCDKERFFSFRRDSKTKYGEMLSFVMIN